MDRLSPLDAGFWELENEHAGLHIGGVAVFDGPAPAQEEVLRRYRSRMAIMPRYTQKMRPVPLRLGWPVWVDDSDFDLDYHLRRTALPWPGGEAELHRLTGRLMSAHLDRRRPLWEVWVVEGLAEDRWALVTKVHHSLADGIAGMELFTGVLDPSPGVAPPHPHPRKRDQSRRSPGRVQLVAAAVGESPSAARRVASLLVSSARHPRRSVAIASAGARGGLGYLRAARPVAASSLSGPVGTPRRYRTATVDIADVNRVRAGLGGSLNDVVLTVVTRGFRDLLLSRGETPSSRSVRCLVPVSVRAPGAARDLANKVSGMLVDLPVDFDEIASAHGAVVARMHQLKASHEAEAGEMLTMLAGMLPAPAVAAALHAAFSVPQHTITTVTTNVPGPRQAVRMLGRPMRALYPYVPIANQIRIGVAVTSYDGRLYFGVTCDRDHVPDADVLTAGIESGLTDLVKVAVTGAGA